MSHFTAFTAPPAASTTGLEPASPSTGPHATPYTPQQARIVARLQTLGRLMDTAYTIPLIHVRVGWDGILGLLPVAGDTLTTCVSLYIIAEAQRLGVSKWTTIRMVANVAIDAAVGVIPVLGDIFDVAFKANMRNLHLLGISTRHG